MCVAVNKWVSVSEIATWNNCLAINNLWNSTETHETSYPFPKYDLKTDFKNYRTGGLLTAKTVKGLVS